MKTLYTFIICAVCAAACFIAPNQVMAVPSTTVQTQSVELGTLPSNLALAVLGGSSSSGTLTAAQIALLPQDFAAQDAIADIVAEFVSDPSFSYSVAYTLNARTGLYDFSLSYNYTADNLTKSSYSDSAQYSAILNVTGGPPCDVCYEQPFDVNFTVETVSCQNTANNLTATVSTQNGKSLSQTTFIFYEDGARQTNTSYNGDNTCYDNYQDFHFGSFKAPKATDIKTGSTTYADSPELNVGLNLSAAVTTYWYNTSGGYAPSGPLYQIASMAENGGWTVNLVGAPQSSLQTKSVMATAIAKPSVPYKSWFTPSVPAKVTITVPAKN